MKAAVFQPPSADLYYLFINMLTRWSYLHWRTCWYPLFCELKQQSCFFFPLYTYADTQKLPELFFFFAASCLSLPCSRSHVPFLTSATACLRKPEKWMFERSGEPSVQLKGWDLTAQSEMRHYSWIVIINLMERFEGKRKTQMERKLGFAYSETKHYMLQLSNICRLY